MEKATIIGIDLAASIPTSRCDQRRASGVSQASVAQLLGCWLSSRRGSGTEPHHYGTVTKRPSTAFVAHQRATRAL